MNENVKPTIQSILPVTTQEVIAKALNEDFKSTLKLPKGMNRHLVARGIDRCILANKPIEQTKTKKEMGLTVSEVNYINLVVVEYKDWEMANRITTVTNTSSSEIKNTTETTL